ncbi:hypothetical protein ACP70R_028958 [Stipagrostis hirtigluma subsp. patula]
MGSARGPGSHRRRRHPRPPARDAATAASAREVS